MKFIFAYRLKRKNARRKLYAKISASSEYEAVRQFEAYCNMRYEEDKGMKQWELLTGDWKHIGYFCNECKRLMDARCLECDFNMEGSEEE